MILKKIDNKQKTKSLYPINITIEMPFDLQHQKKAKMELKCIIKKIGNRLFS
jgi:hypothetical protein